MDGGERRPGAVVAIGGSAGSIEPLMRIIRDLPPDLDAAVLVVVHLPEGGRTLLGPILTRVGSMPAAIATDGEPLTRGVVRVAPPGRHLLVRGRALALDSGARINGHRPAVDPLFRSVARLFGRRAVGVVLSGALDDGSDGVRAIELRGGMTIVQDPADALFPDMPANARAAGAGHAAGASEIARLVEQLLSEVSRDTDRTSPRPARGPKAARIAMATRGKAIDSTADQGHPAPHTPGPFDPPKGADRDELLAPSTYSCPACGGVLWETRDDHPAYHCRVGHAYSPAALGAAQDEVVEDALWMAVRALEEQASLHERVGSRARAQGDASAAARFDERRRDATDRAERIRDVLRAAAAPPPVVAAEARGTARVQ